MQIILHESSQETATGNTLDYVEPGFTITALVVTVSQISVNLLGNVMMKVQYSFDGSTWLDVPNLATGAITATNTITVNLSGGFPTGDHVRLAWTFNNANSITFTAFALGVK